VSQSQFEASYVEDYQPSIDQMPPDLDVFEVSPMVPPFVASSFVLAQPNAVAHAAAQQAASKDKKEGRWKSMKWQPFLSTFLLNKMCEFIASVVRADKGFKEVGSCLIRCVNS
jgi:hypothetical protein